MSAPFVFGFLPSSEEEQTPPTVAPPVERSAERSDEQDKNTSFVWLDDLESRFEKSLQEDIPNDLIHLSPTDSSQFLRRVQERSSSSSRRFQNSDLVPGIYEGGLKVWECSVDLCCYLQANNICCEGKLLELGCGHGLPGCWALKQARLRQQSTFVVFSDFNQFVLTDVTIANIAINTKGSSSNPNEFKELATWLSEHVGLGAGDWNRMSKQLLEEPQKQPPRDSQDDGKFDFILAAETTYSETAAMDTARLIAKHLKRGTGVAYVATKRYYFGVGGGSDCFRSALAAQPLSSTFQVETVKVYDNGAGNIRELLEVKSLPC